MATLLDKIMRSGFRRGHLEGDRFRPYSDCHTEWLEAVAEKGEVFEIDNVLTYYHQQAKPKGWPFDDFPTLAPPFELFWMEGRGVSLGKGESPAGWELTRIGLAVLALGPHQITMESLEAWGLKHAWPVVPYWVMCMMPFGEHLNGTITWWGERTMGLTAEGKVCRLADGSQLCVDQLDHHWPNKETREEGLCLLETVCQPFLLAISFLHCKNVHVVPTAPIPPKIARAHRRRTGRELIRSKTLVIEPMRKVLEREGDATRTGLRKALHICRGHFKDYREGRGLFGSVHGLWWWEHHLRGSGEEGVQLKSYSVRSPKGEQ